MTSWYSLYSWSSISVSYRSRSSALTPLTVRPRPHSEECRSAEGPHAHNRPPYDGSTPNRSEDATVRRVRAVVPHHPQIALGNLDGPEVRRRRSWRQVGLDQLLAVDEHVAVLALDGLARSPDHALDVLLGRRLQHADRLEHVADDAPDTFALRLLLHARRSGRRIEHDDVAAVGVVQVVGDLRHDDAVADVQLRDHRARRDVEGLGDERLHQEGDQDRQADEERDLLGQLAPTGCLLLHGERR